MTNREAFTRAERLARHDRRLSAAIRPYVERYGRSGIRRLADAASVELLLAELEGDNA